MRKMNKKEWMEVIACLQNANAVLQKKLNVAEDFNDRVADGICECQQCAILVGNQIEKEKVQTDIIAHLEEYCELLYAMSVERDMEMVRQHMKKIDQILGALRTEISEQLPDEKKEVVFLPYKASMWDSLESVWKSAQEDPNCDAYVIPIPYYDKKANGTLGEFHYEEELYPEYVPITDYREYDWKENHPDIIFVHNPYDEFNTVTSIHPDFYLKKVKAYTDKLVYIPYFVLDDIEPDNQEAIDKISHFCFLPGTMYADYVIVQSEKIRQVYINEYCKAAKEHFLPVERAQVEQRFLGLGSPKYEKVLNTKKEELEIPPEWLSMMQQPDGTPKRIIFYNITLAPFLQNSEQMLKKINEVFQVFRDSREKVALLWRPHPLMQQTIASMRPALQQTYDHLVQQYRTEGWGIYDDTPDLNRAIALSDAYYGDESSVIFLYEKTGKPILKHLIENDTHEIREILMSDGRVGEEVTLKEYIDMVVEGTLGKTQVSIREQRVGKSIWETLKKL